MGGKKILVVDDSQTVLDAVSIMLEEEGFEVLTLTDGALFASTINRARPDLVLVDVSMPVVVGQLLVGLARRHHLHPCVIALHSSQPEADLARIAQECGADGYVCKTSDANELARHVKRLLQRAPKAAA